MTQQSTHIDGKDVVNKYYEYYNASNIDGVMSLMAEDCKYHDMIYSDPFEGHEEIRTYFDKVMSWADKMTLCTFLSMFCLPAFQCVSVLP